MHVRFFSFSLIVVRRVVWLIDLSLLQETDLAITEAKNLLYCILNSIDNIIGYLITSYCERVILTSPLVSILTV